MMIPRMTFLLRFTAMMVLAAGLLIVSPPLHAAEPWKAERGALPVEVERLTWRDEGRGRDVPVRIFAPALEVGAGPFPLIAFSHGFGETRDTYGHLADHWASHGYVVIIANHQGTDRAALAAMRGGERSALAPFDVRPADIRFVIDQALDGAGLDILTGRIDSDSIGVGGHSLGSTTALAMVGLTRYLAADRTATYRDERVKAAIAMSVQVGNALDEEAQPGALEVGLTRRSWDTIATPAMVMMGTKDFGLGILRDQPELRRIVYDSLPEGDKFLVNIEEARHHAFSDTPAYYDQTPRDARHYAWINQATMAFYDAYLRGDEAAEAWLKSNTLSTLTGGEVHQENK